MKETRSRRVDIPDKVYFRIGEVSGLVGVDAHVLRYWESEFKIIKPRRAKSKQRLYRRKDVENLLKIKNLLHNEGYTIAGARRLLRHPSTTKVEKKSSSPVPTKEFVSVIKKELQDIVEIVSR